MPHRTDFYNDAKKTFTSAFLGRLEAAVYMFTVDGNGGLDLRRAGRRHRYGADVDGVSWSGFQRVGQQRQHAPVLQQRPRREVAHTGSGEERERGGCADEAQAARTAGGGGSC